MDSGFCGCEKSNILKSRGINAVFYKTVDSTNSEARRYAADGGCAPALFAADGQTAGRGRMGRSFYSPDSTGIYMTLLLDVTDDALPTAVAITSATAVAVARVIEEYTGVRGGIKWVNDIYVGGRKVCGILAESFAVSDRRYVSVGVGINLSTRDFPDELKDVAGSLGLEDADGLRAEMTAALGARIYDAYQSVRAGERGYMDEYRARSVVLGKRVTFIENGVTGMGTATSVRDDGSLEVTLECGTVKILASGEISLKLS